MKFISWNMNQRVVNWSVLADLMREHDATAAMVQEAVRPPDALPDGIQILGDPRSCGRPEHLARLWRQEMGARLPLRVRPFGSVRNSPRRAPSDGWIATTRMSMQGWRGLLACAHLPTRASPRQQAPSARLCI